MTKAKFNKVLSVFVCFIMLAVILMPQRSMKANAVTSAELSISDNGISFICAREGFHATCYSDYSQSSIGYGTKCTGSSVQPHASGSHTITKEAAMAALKTQINNTYAQRVRAQTSGITMNQNQFDALVSLCYNCGGGTTLISNSPLVKYLKGQLTESQARSQYSNYIVTAGGQRLQGLVNRRNAEADLFFKNGKTELSSPVVKTNSKTYAPDSTVEVTWNSIGGATGYWIDIWKDGEHILTSNLNNTTAYSLKVSNGEYGVFVTAYADNGNWSAVTSDVYNFTVKDINSPVVKTNYKYYAPNAEIDIMWDSVKGATGYWIDIWKNGEHTVSENVGLLNKFTGKFETGEYGVFVTSYDDSNGGWSASTSNVYNFHVVKMSKPKVYTSDKLYPENANVDILWDPIKGATGYWIDIWKDGEHIYTSNVGETYAYKTSVTSGKYGVFITAFNENGGWTTETSDSYTFTVLGKLNLSFNANGGSVSTKSKKVDYGSTYGTLPTPTRKGFSFNGWYTAKSGGTKITSSTKFNASADQTLYAQWTANEYTLKFDANGGSVSPTSAKIKTDSVYSLPTPTRKGFSFNGWYTAKSGGTKITSSTKFTAAANQTLYAQWTAIPVETTTTTTTISSISTTSVTETFSTTTTVPTLEVEKTELTLENGEQHTIIANQENLTYKSNTSNVAVVSKSGIITAVGEGEAVISVINNEGDVVQIKVTVVTVSIVGDCNNDGKFNVSDVILLQKWLLAVPDTYLTNWQAADLCEDGRLDVFDLVMMKRKLINS